MSDQPQIEISCPHCGGSSSWNLLQTLNQCSFCGSVLSWPYPEGEPDYLVSDTVINKEDDLIDVLAMYDAMREASRQRAMRRPVKSDYESNLSFDLGAGFTDTDIYEIKRKRIGQFKLLKSFGVYVPYQLICSLLAFHVLGRTSGDQKVFQTLFFLSEAVVPGYSNEWNFRDKGLQLSKQRLRPLASLKTKQNFIAPVSPDVEAEKATRQWLNNRNLIEVELTPICFQGKTLESHRWWVYRPYYFVNARTPQGNEWFLVDGQFGTIAGTPSGIEVTKLSRANWKKLDLHAVRSVYVQVIPFRCPNCGWDVKLKQSTFQICDNCTRLLAIENGGLKNVPYSILPPNDLSWWPESHRGRKCWLPFWRLKLSILFEKKTYQDFAALIRDVIPALKSNTGQKYFFIPAFDCWTVAKYDHWAFQFGASLGSVEKKPADSALHEAIKKDDFIISPVVSEDLLPSLFPNIAPMYTNSAVQARLNTLLVNRLSQMQVRITEKQMVFAPAAILEERSSEPRVHGPRGTVEWIPLRNGNYAPMLHRTVRRWKAMEKDEPSS
jgi:ribosomal protein S27E